MKTFLLSIIGEYAPSQLLLVSFGPQAIEKIKEVQALVLKHEFISIDFSIYDLKDGKQSFVAPEAPEDASEDTVYLYDSALEGASVELTEEEAAPLVIDNSEEGLRFTRITVTSGYVYVIVDYKHGSGDFESRSIELETLFS